MFGGWMDATTSAVRLLAKLDSMLDVRCWMFDVFHSPMKSLTDIFIKRPVLAIVVNLVILIAGFQAIKTLTVRQYPRSENATVTITTVYVGASAELVRGFITTPIERAVAAADGIDYIESQSDKGLSTINVRLELNVNT